MSEIGIPVREWEIKENPIPNVPQPEPRREEIVKTPERELEKVTTSEMSEEEIPSTIPLPWEDEDEHDDEFEEEFEEEEDSWDEDESEENDKSLEEESEAAIQAFLKW